MVRQAHHMGTKTRRVLGGEFSCVRASGSHAALWAVVFSRRRSAPEASLVAIRHLVHEPIPMAIGIGSGATLTWGFWDRCLDTDTQGTSLHGIYTD
jgi:hypothetical protein